MVNLEAPQAKLLSQTRSKLGSRSPVSAAAVSATMTKASIIRTFRCVAKSHAVACWRMIKGARTRVVRKPLAPRVGLSPLFYYTYFAHK